MPEQYNDVLRYAEACILNPTDSQGRRCVETHEGAHDTQNWSCLPLVVSYCRDIPEKKDILCVEYGLSVGGSSIGCLTTMTDVQNQLKRESHP